MQIIRFVNFQDTPNKNRELKRKLTGALSVLLKIKEMIPRTS